LPQDQDGNSRRDDDQARTAPQWRVAHHASRATHTERLSPCPPAAVSAPPTMTTRSSARRRRCGWSAGRSWRCVLRAAGGAGDLPGGHDHLPDAAAPPAAQDTRGW